MLKDKVIYALLLTLLPILIVYGEDYPSATALPPASASSVTVPYPVFGLNFSPYLDGQDPNLHSPISQEQLLQRMAIIEPYTTWVRTFGMADGLEHSGAIARQLRLKIAMGAWIDKNSSTNETQIARLIAAADAGEADLLIVGSEVLLRNDLSEDTLLNYINRVKQAVPGISVSYADVYGQLLDHPRVIAACDVILVNYYPYWEGIAVDRAMAVIHGLHQQLRTAAGGKPVIVSETGWPSAGNQVGNATPSLDNASWYFLNFVSWAHADRVDYFYFEAFDESWKGQPETPQEAHWGVWDTTGQLKAGMEAVFQGDVLSDNWSGAMPGGPGQPTIEFTYVPYNDPYALRGQVWHVIPADYRIALYIYVGSGWWTKPYWDRPTTAILPEGSWHGKIVTHLNDAGATRIAAFLVPKDYAPPRLAGQASLPAALYQQAVAHTEVTRPLSAYTLTVAKTGPGMVSSQPEGIGTATGSDGIDCGGDCLESYVTGTSVTLVARPALNAVFTGWSGACTGTGDCQVTLDQARTVAATFRPRCPHDRDCDGMPNGVEITQGTDPNVRDNDIFNNPRLFAMQQYRDLLSREAEPAGAEYWSQVIANGTYTPAQVVELFFTSPEFSTLIAPIVRLYFAAFGRVADYGGLRYWSEKYRNGTPLEAIAQYFATSPEFLDNYGTLSNAEFARRLYLNVLGREPEPGAKEWWAGQMDSGRLTRGQALLGFSDSAEHRQRTAHAVIVVMLYVGLLRRAPEPGGLEYWVGYLNAGHSLLGLIQGFLDALEYHDRFLP